MSEVFDYEKCSDWELTRRYYEEKDEYAFEILMLRLEDTIRSAAKFATYHTMKNKRVVRSGSNIANTERLQDEIKERIRENLSRYILPRFSRDNPEDSEKYLQGYIRRASIWARVEYFKDPYVQITFRTDAHSNTDFSDPNDDQSNRLESIPDPKSIPSRHMTFFEVVRDRLLKLGRSHVFCVEILYDHYVADIPIKDIATNWGYNSDYISKIHRQNIKAIRSMGLWKSRNNE